MSKGKPQFIEGFSNPHCDALAGHGHVDFDYPAVEEPNLDVDELQKLAESLRHIIDWACTNDPVRNRKTISLKMIAMAWVLCPGRFEGESQSVLARKLGVSRAMISKHAADFSARFRVRNHGQAHGWNWKGKGSNAPQIMHSQCENCPLRRVLDEEEDKQAQPKTKRLISNPTTRSGAYQQRA